MPPLTYPAVLLFFFSNILTCRGELDPVSSASIYYANEFQTQLECVQDCIWHYQAYDDVVVAIGCGRPWTNGCICQPDLSSSVSSFLSTCVVANCSSATRQVTSALSVYSLYCAGSATFPSTTRDISSSSTSATPGSGITSAPTQTTTSPPLDTVQPSSSKDSGLSTGDIAGIISAIFGVLAVVVTILAIAYKDEFMAWVHSFVHAITCGCCGSPRRNTGQQHGESQPLQQDKSSV